MPVRGSAHTPCSLSTCSGSGRDEGAATTRYEPTSATADDRQWVGVFVETIIPPCAKHAHNMSASDDPRRVHFQSPRDLVERLDAIADLYDKDRTDLLIEAIREYIEDTADSESFQDRVATKFYDDQLEFETVKQLVGAETAQRLRLLKADLADEPLNLAAPEDIDIYDETTSSPADDV